MKIRTCLSAVVYIVIASLPALADDRIEKLSSDAQVQVNKKNWKKGAEIYHRLAALAQKDGVIDSFVPFAYNNAGFCLQAQNEFDVALSMYDSALMYLTAESDSYKLWRNVSLHNKACALRYAGLADSSLSLSRKALSDCVKDGNVKMRMKENISSKLPDAYLANGDTSTAESLLIDNWSKTAESVKVRKEGLRGLSRVVTDLAVVYVQNRQWDEATKVYGYLDAISEKVKEEEEQVIESLTPKYKITGDYDVTNPPVIISSFEYVGTSPVTIDGYLLHWRPDFERQYRIARARGIFERERDSLKGSERHLQKARDIADEYYHSPSVQTMESYLDLAKLYVKMKEKRKASKLVSRAVKDIEKLFKDNPESQRTHLAEVIEVYTALGKDKDVKKLSAKMAKLD